MKGVIDIAQNDLRTPTSSIFRQARYNIELLRLGIKENIKIRMKYGANVYKRHMQAPIPSGDLITAVAIVKNEAEYISEWIEYHKIIGVDHFYIYDNGSTDNLLSVLSRYIQSGLVEYIYFPGDGMQERAYLDAAKRANAVYSWMIVIDIDEFFQPLSNVSLRSWLRQMSLSISQIEIGWTIFGSSGYINRPNGLVIDSFVHHAEYNFISDYKAIVRPSRVIDCFMPHKFVVGGTTINEDGKRLTFYPLVLLGARPAPRKLFRINHYYSKSLAEFQEKSKRGDASLPNRKPRSMEDFRVHDRNEVRDDSMKKYAELVELNMGKRNPDGKR